MRVITTGPPKCGTTALRACVQKLGFTMVPGALIYGEWKRHADWVEQNRSSLPKSIVKEHIVRRQPEDAYKALQDGYMLHGHIPAPTPLDIPTIVILRDPRAAMVSWFRAKQASKQGIYDKEPSEHSYLRYSKWLKRAGALRAASYIRPIIDSWVDESPRSNLLIIDYETFFTQETMQLIADFLGADPIDPKKLYGKGAKFSGKPTDIRQWYSSVTLKRFDQVWKKAKDNAKGLRAFKEGDTDIRDNFQLKLDQKLKSEGARRVKSLSRESSSSDRIDPTQSSNVDLRVWKPTS